MISKINILEIIKHFKFIDLKSKSKFKFSNTTHAYQKEVKRVLSVKQTVMQCTKVGSLTAICWVFKANGY